MTCVSYGLWDNPFGPGDGNSEEKRPRVANAKKQTEQPQQGSGHPPQKQQKKQPKGVAQMQKELAVSERVIAEATQMRKHFG